MTAAKRVYIVGFMGSGKTTAGKKLAATLGWQFIDLDREIELKAGQSINNIFSEAGEDHFRKLESETLKNIKTDRDAVISTGGGTPCRDDNMDFMLSSGIVIYLKMTPPQLMGRLENSKSSRPLINRLNKEELLAFISKKLTERDLYYLKATIVTDGFDLNTSDLALRIKATF